MMQLYTYRFSGNCWKIRILLNMLGLSAEQVELDLRANENRSSSFLAINPNGQVPTLVDDGIIIPDSASILIYLALKYGGPEWFPEDPVECAEVYKWFTVVGDGVDQGVFAARMVKMFDAHYDYSASVERGKKLLIRLNSHFSTHEWLVGSKMTVADLHMYPYVRLAEDGGIALDSYQDLDQWFKRIEGLPSYIAMNA